MTVLELLQHSQLKQSSAYGENDYLNQVVKLVLFGTKEKLQKFLLKDAQVKNIHGVLVSVATNSTGFRFLTKNVKEYAGSVLHFAVIRNDVEIFDMLANTATFDDLIQVDSLGLTPLMCAVLSESQSDVFKACLIKSPVQTVAFLHSSILLEQEESVLSYLSAKGNVKFLDLVLRRSSTENSSEFCKGAFFQKTISASIIAAASNGQVLACQLLLELNEAPDVVTLLAAKQLAENFQPVCTLFESVLIEHFGVPALLPSSRRYDFVEFFPTFYSQVIKLALDCYIKAVNWRLEFGQPVLEHQAELHELVFSPNFKKEQFIQYLRALDGAVFLKSDIIESASSICSSLGCKALSDTSDLLVISALNYLDSCSGLTLWHRILNDLTCFDDKSVTVLRLLAPFIRPNVRSAHLGLSTLHCLCFKKPQSPADAAWLVHAMEVAFEYGANPNLRDWEGNTCLHYAVKSSTEFSQPIVDLLIQRGATSDLKNNKGESPNMLVEAMGYSVIIPFNQWSPNVVDKNEVKSYKSDSSQSSPKESLLFSSSLSSDVSSLEFCSISPRIEKIIPAVPLKNPHRRLQTRQSIPVANPVPSNLEASLPSLYLTKTPLNPVRNSIQLQFDPLKIKSKKDGSFSESIESDKILSKPSNSATKLTGLLKEMEFFLANEAGNIETLIQL